MKEILNIRNNLELRIFTLADAQDFFDVTRKNNAHLRKWLWWLDDDTNVEDTRSYIRESKKRLADNEGIDWCIWYEEKLVGGIGVFPLDYANKKVSIAYWLAEDYQGKGIMHDSLKMVIEYLFTKLHIHRIEITCAVGNVRSSALPRKLGFTFEGIARESSWLYDHFTDIEVYSLLASEMINKQ